MLTAKRTITFRQVLITLTIIMLANLCVNLFTGSTHVKETTTPVVIEHVDSVSTDESIKLMKDYQLDVKYNGDIIVYGIEGNTQIYIGVYKYGSKCDLLKIMQDYDRAND